MSPADISGMNIGMKNGLTRLGPPSSRRLCCFSNVEIPPIPLPKITPNRLASVPSGAPSGSPADESACAEAAIEKSDTRSKRFASRFSM